VSILSESRVVLSTRSQTACSCKTWSCLRRVTRQQAVKRAIQKKALTSSDGDAGERPVGARAGAAEDVVVLGAARRRAGDLVQLEVRDRDASGRLAGGRAVLVVLLDDDAVLGDAGERDAGVGDVGDGARRAVHGLDPYAVLRVDHLRVCERHVLDRVVVAAAHGADGEAVATVAVQVL
jgi:hypothetical protein